MKRNALNPNPVIGQFTWVSNGAKLQCKYGTTTSTLKVTPESPNKESEEQPLATIDDYKVLKNVFPFGQCKKQVHQPPTCQNDTILDTNGSN